MEERGLFAAWGADCFSSKSPEIIDHVIMHCSEGVYFWDVLQQTLHKDFPLYPHGIRILAIDNEDGVPHDLVMALGLHSIWLSRTARLYNDVNARCAREYFMESIGRFVEFIKFRRELPDWLPQIEQLIDVMAF